jgi:rhodanese-related sulfurtransferase
MAKHTPRFLKIVNDAKSRVRELNVDDVKKKLEQGQKFHLVDVREESEFAAGHLPGARHLGKGIIERDIESQIPDTGAEIATSGRWTVDSAGGKMRDTPYTSDATMGRA